MERNPAYIQLGPVGVPQIFNENSAAAYNDAELSQHQEPTYEIIPPDTIKNIPQRKQNVNCKQNLAYIHLRVHRSTEESFQTDETSQCDQNPAYGIHSNP